MADIFDPFAPPKRPVASSAAPAINDPFPPPPRPGTGNAIAQFDAARAAAPPPRPGAGMLDVPKELGASALEGTGALIGGIGDVGRIAAKPIVGAVNTIAGEEVLPAPVNPFAKPARAVQDLGEAIADTESDAAKEAKAKPIVTGDITDPSSISLGEGAKSPLALALGAAGLVGQAAPLLAGGIETRGLKLTADAAEALPGILAKVRGGEALTAAEQSIADTVSAASKAATRRTVAGGAAIGGAQGAEGASQSERARIEGMSDADIAKLPTYADKIAAGRTPEQARAETAQEAGDAAFAATLPVATAAGVVSTAPLVHEAQGALARVVGESAARRAAAGAALEAPVQAGVGAAQNAAEIAGANAATGEDRSLGENGVAAAGAGALMGAGFGALGGVAHNERAAPRFPDAAPGSLSEAVNTMDAHTATAKTSTENEVARADAEQAATEAAAKAAAKAPAAAEDSANAGAPASGEGASGSAAAAEEPAPSNPFADVPWINRESGEIRVPTDDEVKDQFHRMFANASAQGASMSTTAARAQLADDWGVPRERLNALRRQALEERNRGFNAGDVRAPAPTEQTTETNNAAPKATDAADAAGTAQPQRARGDLAAAVPPNEERSRTSGVEAKPDAGDSPAPVRDESATAPAEPSDAKTDARAGADGAPIQPRGEQEGGEVANGKAESESAPAPGADEPRAVGDAAAEVLPAGRAVDRGVVPAAEEPAQNDAAGAVRPESTEAPRAAASEKSGAVDAAARESAAHPENDLTEPTAAQHEAGNFASGHVNLHGLDVTIQVPKGGMRRGTARDGTTWEREASDHYGHIRRTTGADGEQVDVYLGPHAEKPNAKVFVIDQTRPGSKVFDEHKAMIGYDTGRAARKSYEANFPKGLGTFGGIREMSMEEFKAWAKSDAAAKPATDKVQLPPTEARARGERLSKDQLAAAAQDKAKAETAREALAPEERSAARQRILGGDRLDVADVHAVLGDSPLSRREALAAIEELRSGSPVDAGDLASLPSTKEGRSQRFSPADIAAAERARFRSMRGLAAETSAGEAASRSARGSFRLPPTSAERTEAAAAAHHDAIERAVRDVVKNWGEGAPRVRVVESPNELPAVAKSHQRFEEARGFAHKGSVYLVSRNQASVHEALRTLAHEAVGHYGVDKIIDQHAKGGLDQLLGDIETLRTSGRGSAEMKSVFADVERRYPGADARTRSRETIAIMAERGLRNGLIGRAVAAVREFLRKLMPTLRFTDADIRGLLARSEQALRDGTPLDQRQAALAAAGSFDFGAAEAAGLPNRRQQDPAEIAEAARAWRAEGTNSPFFKKFFGESKVVDAKGEPRVMFHGTGEDFSVFDAKRAGAATEHSTSPLGHFFTSDEKLARRYAENAADGRPADERVVKAYLKVEKPYELTLDRAQEIETPAEARALRAKLEREGYDGIHIKEAGSWIAFKSEQIKSVENRGTFDARTGDINFSLPSASMDTLHEVLSKPDETMFERARAWVRGKYEDFKPALLGALQTRHIIEVMEDHPALKGAREYQDEMQRLGSTRQQLMTGEHDAAEHPNNMLKRGGAVISQQLRDFTYEKGPAGWFGRRRPEADELFKIQHDATIYGIDPSEDYHRLEIEDSQGVAQPWTKKLIKERVAALHGQMRGRPGDDKTRLMDEVKRIRGLPAREQLREKRWPELVARYQALSDEGKSLYRQQRDWHSQMRDETEKALVARINALGQEIGKPHLQSVAAKIREQFESQRRDGVYFPLNRDGDFWLSFSDKNGEQGFKMFESAREAAAAEKKLRASGFRIEAQGRRDGSYRAKDAPSGTFVKDIVQLLQKAGAPEKTQDDVYQLFLKTLPEMSMRKHSIHRKGIAGYSEDGLRAFAKNAFHGAHQLSRLRHAHQMQAIIDGMQIAMDNYRRPFEVGQSSESHALDVARGDALLGELKKRHDFIMSPKDSQLANVANSVGFLYYLGASPASALVNLTQNAQVTLPVLGAHHGWTKASRVMGAALRDSMRTFGNIDRTLTNPEERQAYNVLRSRGDIDKTQSHTLAGLSEGSLLQTNPVWSKAMAGMSYMFHKAEVVNREATGMAAYRLARARGDTFNDAVKYASDIINGTHFDYSAANRPRLMQGNVAKMALQFKNYAVGMSWMLYRNLYQSFKGETPEVRSVARKTLTGVLGMTAVLAGTMGLPMINAMRAAGNAAHALFGDDEPFDFDTEYRKWLGEHVGEEGAKWIADGAVNRLGANVAGRVGLSDMWFREPDRELEGKDAYYALLESLAGPLGGMVKNMYVGTQQVSDGNVERGVETMMPKFAKDAMKAMRFEHEGANMLRGDPILPDISGPEAFMQGLGFQPTRLFEQQRENSALMNYQREVLDRRQTLMNAYAMATRAGDDRDVAMEKIHEFNRQYPEIALTADSIRQSLRARARYSQEAEGGVALNRKLAPRLRDAVGAQL